MVSIPYGSIKSANAINQQYQTQVSIPYGSIKRCESAWDFGRVDMFQFLMVRLKVLPVLYGNSVQYLFQFLMVRLKASGESSIKVGVLSFQFLMVRLKGTSLRG